MATGPQPLSDDAVTKKLAEFDAVPLFMKSLPSEEVDDDALAALQSLAHEGTPDEVAQNFKEQGNEYFRGKRHREALGFYAQGIEARPTNPELREALLCNRAACNLELENYGSTLRDCSTALAANASCSKAYYRSALALLALERVDEALDCCNRCLAYDGQNKGVKDVKARVERAKAEKEEKERKRLELIRKESEKERRLKLAFRERHLIVLRNPTGSTNPTSPMFDPEDTSGKTLTFPVFFLYPQYATSDIISQFIEDTPFAAYISTMFPPQVPSPEWDVEHEYISGELVIYTITHRKRLLKVGKKMTLRDVFVASKAKEGDPPDGLELKDGCLTFIILPKGDVEKRWVEECKRQRDNQ